MKIRRVPFAHCAACGKALFYGNAYVNFVRHIEQFDLTPQHPNGEITVIDGEDLLTLCGGCGNRFSAVRATQVLEASLNQPEFIMN